MGEPRTLNMRWFYRYFFYRLYSWNMRSWKDPVPARSQAMATVCAIVMTNIFSTILFADFITGLKLFNYYINGWSTLEFIGAIFLLFLTLRLLVFTSGGKQIIEEFDKMNETDAEKKKRDIWLWVYGIGSFIAFIFSICLP